MSSFAMRGANATLRYDFGGGTHIAKVRVSKFNYTYSVRSTESHSRMERAFYPHRRSLGEFTIVVDAIHYPEFRQFMGWLREYIDRMFSLQMGNGHGALMMEVQIPSRRFHVYGILTEGVNDHDHVGSMTFSEPLKFLTLKDFHDAGTSIVSTKAISSFVPPKVQNVLTGIGRKRNVKTVEDPSGADAFYPVTISRYKDIDEHLYSDLPITPGTETTTTTNSDGSTTTDTTTVNGDGSTSSSETVTIPDQPPPFTPNPVNGPPPPQ